ncbi:GYDIA family GHMP kinase [Flavobacterium columnare]|uniref:GHMP kinase n=1 Tax=Flavobacterium columnare TaxID=996 RepID=A0AA94JPF5_9FLAO|nr:GYDIA family GHMP kinase [Flavobacterium columnare]MCH4829321.1 GHMP kinase [Flavobacterium columnare]MCH4834097.1 GHMP kinase [Flavobacterium columnare]
MKQTFYSNGKLLITGEYVVLDGAQALALPTKFGQNLIIEEGLPNTFEWTSYDSDGSIWFESSFSLQEVLAKKEFKEDKIKTRLVEILYHGYLLNKEFFKKHSGYKIKTELTFPKTWGLGTSSTLINNIAQWLEIDAFTLLKNSFGGSGYDIACAKYSSPIIYQLIDGKPHTIETDFFPDFIDQIYFVYLNQKQNSRTAIKRYNEKKADIKTIIPRINTLTQQVINATEIESFSKALELHEIEMSTILEKQTVKETLFTDFNGVVKSLGAWGGDFVMVVSKENPLSYFLDKGYTVILSYKDIIL